MRSAKFILTLCMALCLSEGYAQEDDFRADFDSFRKQAHKDFQDFRDKANASYAEFVRNAWKQFRTLPAVPKPEDDKQPPVVIKDEDKRKPIEDKPVVIEEEIKVPAPKPQPKPIEPIRPQPEPIEEDTKPVVPVENTLAFTLYGTQMAVRDNGRMRHSMTDTSPESIAAAWEKFATADYNNLIIDCLELRKRHRLCDWAYLTLLDTVSQALLGKDTDAAEMLKAFLFCQSGYQMRLALEGSRLRMLYGSQYFLFDKPCWKIDGTFFYSDKVKSGQIDVCAAAFPHEQAMSMVIAQEQQLTRRMSAARTLQSKAEAGLKATSSVDENLIAFYNTYPTSYFGDNFMTRWALYANTPMSRAVKDRLYPQLKELLKGRTPYESVDILCRWIQTAFVYEYDDKVWGGDRAFFSEESLYYPYCDCEDRSILLTRLVRDLFGLRCALVYYPGHLATAIAIGEEAKGDHLRIGGTKFLVCDPTYIGASIGMTMPDMDNKTAKVIVLR